MKQKSLNIHEKIQEFACLQLMCFGVSFVAFILCYLGCALAFLEPNPANWGAKAQASVILLPVFVYSFYSITFFLDCFID